tara:strand:+ start:152320 stop:152655 length:336 start_codon:yes stop_codon:yes gene_type:complete
MSDIQDMIEQLKPTMDAARIDPHSIPNIHVMELVTERLHHHFKFTRAQATQLTFAMTIEISDRNDINAAVCFLEQGFELLFALAKKLTRSEDSNVLFGPMLEACRDIAVKG